MVVERSVAVLRDFLQSESAGGILLMGAAALALALANSPLSGIYFAALNVNVLGLSLEHWVNDGLMAVFFLLVGLEIKREVLEGQLASWEQRVLPGLGAVGGMAVPAVVGSIWAAVRLGLARIPEGATTRQLYGVAVLCGIGFTMSLFIGTLAYGGHGAESDAVKVGVLAGSMVSAALGAVILGARIRSSP